MYSLTSNTCKAFIVLSDFEFKRTDWRRLIGTSVVALWRFTTRQEDEEYCRQQNVKLSVQSNCRVLIVQWKPEKAGTWLFNEILVSLKIFSLLLSCAMVCVVTDARRVSDQKFYFQMTLTWQLFKIGLTAWNFKTSFFLSRNKALLVNKLF